MPVDEPIESYWEGLRPPKEISEGAPSLDYLMEGLSEAPTEEPIELGRTARVSMLMNDLRALGFPCHAYMREGALHLSIEDDPSISRLQRDRNVLHMQLALPRNPMNPIPTPRNGS